MHRTGRAALGGCLIALLIGLLAPGLLTPVTATDTAADTAASRATRGTLIVRLRTPAGVPAAVELRSGRKERWATKRPGGTATTVKLRVPTGRWVVGPKQVVVDSAIFVGSASKRRVAVRSGERTTVTVTYRAAPSVSGLQVTRINETSLDLSWTAPSGADAEYAVRRAAGDEAPGSAGAGTEVPVSGTTATSIDLVPAATYAFSVFARTPGTTRWWGPVSTTVTMPTAAGTGEPAATVVTNPASIVVEDPGDVSASVTADGVVSSVPAGVVPTPGQPWVLPRTAAMPGGFVGTVTSVSTDGRSVTLAAGGLADAYDYLEISVPDLRDAPTQMLPNRVDGAARAIVSCGGTDESKIVVDPSFDPFGHFDATLSKYKIFGKTVPVGMSFDGRFGVDAGLSADITSKLSAKCKLDLPWFLQTIPAGSVPLMIMIKPEAEVTASGEIAMQNAGFTVTLGAEIEGYVGLGGDDEIDANLIAEAQALHPTFEGLDFSVGALAGVETSVGPGLGNKKAGAMVGLTTKLNALDASLAPGDGVGCLEVNANHSASISLQAKAWLGKLTFERSITVPGLEASNSYPGSPWRFPSTCGGASEYRIAEGTLDVSHTWSGGCSNDQGSCNDGPDYTSSHQFSDTSDAHLVVAEPGPWVAQYDQYPAWLDVPMRFTGWSLNQSNNWHSSGWGCSHTSTEETVGAVQFGSAFWASGAVVLPGAGDALDAQLMHDYYWGDDVPWGEWTDSWWWGSLGAWDTDYSNGFPSIQRRSSWSSGGECQGSDTQVWDQPVEHLGPGWWWPSPYESKRTEPQVTATPLEECTPESCRWQVDGTAAYDFRSQYDTTGYQGTGSATVTWSYVVERRALGAAIP